MQKAIRCVFKTDTFSLHECNDGYWLWDNVLQYNLVMRAKTEQEAYTEALISYQHRFKKLKEQHELLSDKVEAFVQQFVDEED